MSVELQEQRVRYVGNGTAKNFPFPFTIEEPEQVQVVQADAKGTETALVLNQDYSVTLNADGTGSVTLAQALPTGYALAILSAIPATQERAFYNNTPYYQEQIEGGLDKNTRLIQQLEEKVRRSVKAPATDPRTPEQYEADFFNLRDDVQDLRDDVQDMRDDVQDMLAEVGTEIGNHTIITAEGGTAGRTLASRFADVVNVKDFGAVGDGVTDDTVAIQAALNAGAVTSKTVFFSAGVYIVSSSLSLANSKPFSIVGDNATIKLESVQSIARLIRIEATSDVHIEGLHLDVNRKAYVGLYVTKPEVDRDIVCNVSIEAVKIENVYRAGTEFTGGDAIMVSGGFQNVRIVSPVIRNCVAAVGAVIHGSQGIFGITVSRLNKSDVNTSPINVYIENPYIENVYSEDVTCLVDQDAIRCFSMYDTEHANPHTFSIVGGYFKNVRGRSVKGQTDSCYVTGVTVENTEDPAGFVGILSDRPCIDMQVGAGNISDISIFSSSVLWVSFVRMGLNNESFSYNGGGNINNIRAICHGFPQSMVDETHGYVVYVKNDNAVAGQPYTFNISNITVESDFNFQYLIAVKSGTTGQQGYINATNLAARLYGTCMQLRDDSPVTAYVCNAVNLSKYTVPFAEKESDVHKAYGLHLRGIRTGDVIPTAVSDANVTVYSPSSVDGHVVVGKGAVWERILGGGESTGRLALGNVSVPDLYTFNPTLSTNVLAIGCRGSNFVRLKSPQDEATLPSVEPYTSGNTSLGTASYKWSELYAAADTINTSDAREKTSVTDPTEALMRAWGKVNFKSFQFIDAVEKKGEDARIHFGVIAQQVAEVFASEGLDASRYALFCYDKWDDEWEEQEDGTKVLVTPAGDRYGIRYSEALALECAYQRWRLDKLEAKLNN